MSAVTETDGSEDVHDFLMRIRELGDRRDKEDEERTRRLEEEVREKREARAAGEEPHPNEGRHSRSG
jgi:hypothetical protein